MDFLTFLDKAVTQYQAVATVKELLLEGGFQELDLGQAWDLAKGGKYFFIINDGGILAFTVGGGPDRFKVIISHADSPGFRVKPLAQLDSAHYQRVNLEVYGSPIFSTWMDRPLSVAGRVFTKGKDSFSPVRQLVYIDEDLMVIPNAAIHLNPEINRGYEYKAHKDLVALMGSGESRSFLDVIADEIGLAKEDILDFDLFLVSRQRASYLGSSQEYISSGRLDNLATAYPSAMAIKEADGPGVNVCYIAGHEEIGSMGMEGADSPVLRDSLARISASLGLDLDEALAHSFIISADMAHAIHPNLPDLSDKENYALLNQGPVIKYSASKSYMSDGYSASVFKDLAARAGVPIQHYTNRSDQRGGRTIGPISSTKLAVPIVDVGSPLLAMHSSAELAGREDLEMLTQVFQTFYEA